MARLEKYLLLILLTLFLCVGVVTGEEREVPSDTARTIGNDSSNTSRSTVSTNSEKSDRTYRDEEIANAPPPQNRVRKQPAQRPK